MPVPLALKIFRGHVLIGTKEFSRDIIKIGRLSSAHLSLDDDKLSRIHSVIQVSADSQVSLLDMGSAAGTFLNGKRVSKGELHSGDEITLGGMRLVLELRPARAAVTPPAPVADSNVAASLQPLSTSAPPTVADPPADERSQGGAAEPLANLTLSHRARGATLPSREPTDDSLEVRLFWGETLLGSTVRIRPAEITLGSSTTADFTVPEDFLPASTLAIVKTSKQGQVAFRFCGSMEGELQSPGAAPARLSDLVADRQATPEDGAYSLALPSGSLAWASVGPLTVEVELTPAPRRVAAPFWDGLDFRFVNQALLMGFGILAFVISAVTYPLDADTIGDDVVRNPPSVAKFIVGPPPKVPAVDRFKIEDDQRRKPEVSEAAPKPESQAGTTTSKPKDRRLASRLSARDQVMNTALLKLLGANGPLSGAGVASKLDALGNLIGAQIGEAGGFYGLGLRGAVGEGGGGFTGNIGIGAIGTHGLSSALNAGLHGRKPTSDPDLTAGVPSVTGCMDKELVRRVIHEHRSQVKLCYEEELQSHPGLSGKVTVQFVIGATGAVDKSGIDSSSLNDAAVERCIENHVSTWLFPKPTCGGVAQIRYPFLLKEAGE